MSSTVLRTSASTSTHALGGDFAGHDDDPGLDQRLAGHAAARVFLENRIQHRVRDLVGDLVRMAFGDRFGRKEVVIRHGVVPPGSSG